MIKATKKIWLTQNIIWFMGRNDLEIQIFFKPLTFEKYDQELDISSVYIIYM